VCGRLGRSIHEFYSMTLREINNAVNGFEQLREDDYQRYLIGCRIVSFWAYKGHVGKKLRRYDQLFELEGDVKARRDRLKNMKPVEIIHG
jgi:hypothetical protein